MYAIDITVLIVIIFLSAFFSGSEIALISLSRLQVRQMIDKKRKNAELIQRLKSDPHHLLINIAISNNVVNIFGASFATAIALDLFGNKGIGIATGVMTFLILSFGEIMPKALATRHNEKFALFVARPIYITGIILYPLIKFFSIMTHWIKKGHNEKITEDEIKTLVSMGEEEGTIEEINKDMIHNILEFNATDAWEIMTPKPDIICLDIKSSQRIILSTIKKSGLSRIPVYEKDIEHIRGVLYVKDLIPYISKKKKIILEEVIRPTLFIPKSKGIDELLKEFQNKKIHMAIVIDEHGSVEGIVTLEDVLEEIIGEIYDETDKEERPIRKIGKGIWLVKGTAEIELLNKRLKIKIKEPEDSNIVSGLILDKIGRIPKKNEKIIFENMTIQIEKMDHHRIEEVKITKK